MTIKRNIVWIGGLAFGLALLGSSACTNGHFPNPTGPSPTPPVDSRPTWTVKRVPLPLPPLPVPLPD